MHTINAPPPSPIQGATKGIWYSNIIERSVEQVQVDANELLGLPLQNKSWKLCCFPAAQIPVWDQILSRPEIYIAGICNNDEFYEAAVDPSYIQLLLDHNFELNLNYDPTEPADTDIQIHGMYEAKKRADTRFLKIAVKAIRSGLQELGLCYFEIARLHGLLIRLEWAVLYHDILEPDLLVGKRVAQNYLLLSLSLLPTYNTPLALELLGKDQDELLRLFADQSEAKLRRPYREETQIISLIRRLLEFCGGRGDFGQHKFDKEFTANENAYLCVDPIGITGSKLFGQFDTQKMHDALSTSKVFTDNDLQRLDIVELSNQMMSFLRIGHPKGHLDLPAQVLHMLSIRHVNEIGIYITHFYHYQSSLCIPANNMLLLLTWSSTVEGSPLRVLGKWAASDDGLSLYQRSIKDFQNSQTIEQLALTMAALLCYKRLLPYRLTDSTQPIRGSYLADFDALIKGERLTNERTIYERMLFSLLRVLETFTDSFHNICEFLGTVLNTPKPILHRLDGFSDEYWMFMMIEPTHENALVKTNIQHMMEQYVLEATVVLGVDGEEEWVMIESLK